MLVKFKINNQNIEIEENSDEKLSVVLRKRNFLSVKKGCSKGKCGFCSVLLNGKTVSSCSIPVGLLNETSEIETLEYIMGTNEYKIIMHSFLKEGVHFCEYCKASNILFTYEAIKNDLSNSEIQEFAENLSCTCTEQKAFIKGIENAKKIKKAEAEK